MALILVRFACGHQASVLPTVEEPPVCAECGERRVSRTTAPPPRFHGTVTGPSATTEALDAIPVTLKRTT